MNTLKAEKRSMDVKAKKLRREAESSLLPPKGQALPDLF